MKKNINLTAILGPTNTGKTHLAFDRITSYKSGIFGFPLRLLARENYDKAVRKLGIQKVALITGEEKIFPKTAMYFFCTVESMPLNIEVECVVIDEVQLAADYDRGYIFTDRILNLRGVYETIFLGSNIIEKILLNLFPKIKIQKRDRLSNLTFLSKNSLSKLTPRSAIIAFNINSVYEIAESIRTHKGGAAVVLGSLSPRTRNSQVELYEDKKVDYLVATDAIGMGLNLNINHVSFSSLKKFDGRSTRHLHNAELGQIAGRSGRYFNDGTFGVLKSAGSLDPLTIQCIEDHKFENINKIYWRNSDIDFTSIQSVINSFKKFPIKNIFIHKKNAEDEINFRTLSSDNELKPFLKKKYEIMLLWDICRIPDFQKFFNDSYIELLKNIFLTLIKNKGIFPEEWLKSKILKLENYSGGIAELSIKIANIRTWTYISNQSNWLKNPNFWQEKSQEIENNLSDYLHKSLTKRFVDSSASFFLNRENQGKQVKIEVDEKKSIKLNGQIYGYISGFNLELNIPNTDSLFSLAHVKKSIRSMIEEKINNFLKAPIDSLNLGVIRQIKLNEHIKIYWGDEPIGILKKGDKIFSPRADTINSEFLESEKKILIIKKLQEWTDYKISETLKPITKNIDDTVSSEVRSIIYNVYNDLGTKNISDYTNIIKNLNTHDKAGISRSGIRIGAKFFFMPNLLKKNAMELNAILWKIFNGFEVDSYFPLPNDGRVSFTSDINLPDSYWSSIGYKNLDNFKLRVDVFERVFFLARQKIKFGPFIESADMMNPIGCNSEQLRNILFYCGFKSFLLNDDKKLYFNMPRKAKKIVKNNAKKEKIIKIKTKKPEFKNKSIAKITKKNPPNKLNENNKPDPNSPFAVLEKLL